MITLACPTCHLALRMSGDAHEMDYLVGTKSEWYPDLYPCPRNDCEGRMVLTDTIASTDLEHLEIHSLNPQEGFQALHGMGLPTERVCNAEVVADTLRDRSIRAFNLQGLEMLNRTVLHSFTLDNGVRVYLGASPDGAVVYRIAPPSSHVEEFKDGR